MPYVDRPLPEALVLPMLREKPRAKQLANLKPRFKGQLNKITADLKQGIMRGAAECGYDGEGAGGVDGFLLFCAQRHPKHYLALMGKLIPFNLNADVNASVATIGEVKIISVPPDHFFTGPNERDLGTLQHIPPVEAPAPKEPEAPTQRDEAKLIAALESLSVETLEHLAAALNVDQG